MVYHFILETITELFVGPTIMRQTDIIKPHVLRTPSNGYDRPHGASSSHTSPLGQKHRHAQGLPLRLAELPRGNAEPQDEPAAFCQSPRDILRLFPNINTMVVNHATDLAQTGNHPRHRHGAGRQERRRQASQQHLPIRRPRR